jgi:hypothetical protein
VHLESEEVKDEEDSAEPECEKYDEYETSYVAAVNRNSER